MQCYNELLSPTAVTHSVSLPFVNDSSINLVVAKTSLLQVFEVKKTSSSINGADNSTSRSDHATVNLVLVCEYPVAGTITSMARVHLAGSDTGLDALIVAFKDAKMSMLRWDPENHRIATVSIHYYEGAHLHSNAFGPSLHDYRSRITVDPSSKCAALAFGPRHIAILPLTQEADHLAVGDEDMHDHDQTMHSTTQKTDAPINGTTQTRSPYSASFVMSLTALDPSLTHPVDVAFMFEYRDPTFGIVSADRSTSYAHRDQRKDILTYSIITFDIEQRTATTLQSIRGLPSTISRVLPLPRPIGGALLIGADELIHVDQSGKTTGVGVNEFMRSTPACALHDQSDLDLRLEHCIVGPLDSASSGTLLIMLEDGRLALLSFKIDGRSISGLFLTMIKPENGGELGPSSPTTFADLGNGTIFVGSDQASSAVLSWSESLPQQSSSSRKRRHDQIDQDPAESDDGYGEDDIDDDADDDLYGGQPSAATKRAQTASLTNIDPRNCIFRSHHSLQSFAPINSICFGSRVSESQNQTRMGAPGPDLSLIAAVGKKSHSRLVSMGRELVPQVVASIEAQDACSIWTVSVQEETQSTSDVSSRPHDSYLIRHDSSADGEETTVLFSFGQIDDELPTEVSNTDFERDGETVDMGTLRSGTRIVQVRKDDIRSYETDFSLSQIYAVLDPTTEDELQIVHSSFCDPYLLTIQHDTSVRVLRCDKDGELLEIEQTGAGSPSGYTSGCLYRPQYSAPDVAMLWLLTTNGALHVYQLPDLSSPIYTAPNLSALPPVLSSADRQRRAAAKESLMELLVADLGDEDHRAPYLMLRSANNEITIYEMFHFPSAKPTSFTSDMKFRKMTGLHFPTLDNPIRASSHMLRALPDLDGRMVVSVSGPSPLFIIKEPTGLPRLVKFNAARGVRSICSVHTSACSRGFAYIDLQGTLRQCKMPENTTFAHAGWAIQELGIAVPGHEIHHIAYHTTTERYVLVTSEQTDYFPSEEEEKQQPEHNKDLRLRPRIGRYSIRLLAPKTGRITDVYEMREFEMITSLVCAPLEVSEVTHERRELIAVGTMMQRGESNASKGAVHVFDLIEVVPEPGRPETGRRLDLVTMEETKTGITAMMGIDGMLGTAQVLKLMFRGLKEESNQCLPVAFLDAPCYTTALKTLGGTNMWLAADAWKGVWLGGFSEDPYKIALFGQSRPNIEATTVEFLPHETALYIALTDGDQNCHVLQFDPENPESMYGKRLLSRTAFHTGHVATNSLLIPSTSDTHDAVSPLTHESTTTTTRSVLITNSSGSISLLTPVDESRYRRLSALQSGMVYLLDHVAGLNPRAYRSVRIPTATARAGAEMSGGGGGGASGAASLGAAGGGSGGRACIDGDLVARIVEFGAGKRAEILGRCGIEGTMGLFDDLRIVCGDGLDWF